LSVKSRVEAQKALRTGGEGVGKREGHGLAGARNARGYMINLGGHGSQERLGKDQARRRTLGGFCEEYLKNTGDPNYNRKRTKTTGGT